jgi:hypothetical protein
VATLRVQEEQNARPEEEWKEDPSFVIHSPQSTARIVSEVPPFNGFIQSRFWLDE